MLGDCAVGPRCAQIMGISPAVTAKVMGYKPIKRKVKASDFDDLQDDFFEDDECKILKT